MNAPVDLSFVRRSIQLAADAVSHGNQPFGALLVKAGQILLEAENMIFTERDVTDHAEMNLVRLAVRRYDTSFLNNCTLYTSTEPCAMCAGAIYWSGVGTVVYACSAERLGDFTGRGFHVPCRELLSHGTRKLLIDGPVLEDEAVPIHATYWKRDPSTST